MKWGDIINTTENDSSEFLSQLPNIVNRAEERLTDELDDYGLVVVPGKSFGDDQCFRISCASLRGGKNPIAAL